MAEFIKFTEEPSKYRHLEKMSVAEILVNINNEDKTVPDWPLQKPSLKLKNWLL